MSRRNRTTAVDGFGILGGPIGSAESIAPRVPLRRLVRAMLELARHHRRLAHRPTRAQVRDLARWNGRRPGSYLLDPANGELPEPAFGLERQHGRYALVFTASDHGRRREGRKAGRRCAAVGSAASRVRRRRGRRSAHRWVRPAGLGRSVRVPADGVVVEVAEREVLQAGLLGGADAVSALARRDAAFELDGSPRRSVRVARNGGVVVGEAQLCAGCGRSRRTITRGVGQHEVQQAADRHQAPSRRSPSWRSAAHARSGSPERERTGSVRSSHRTAGWPADVGEHVRRAAESVRTMISESVTTAGECRAPARGRDVVAAVWRRRRAHRPAVRRGCRQERQQRVKPKRANVRRRLRRCAR